MPAAFLPSPARGLWHLGPVPLRAYALCLVAGVLAGLWLMVRQYRAIGGRGGVVLDIAVLAVPAGLVAGRAYSVAADFSAYFGGGRDWANVLRVWSGGFGLPGVLAGAAFGTWLYCRRTGTAMSPLAGAAAPALALGQAIGCWGNWFTQNLYGRPSMLAWAVEISPVHRTSGVASYATFQPVFAYESLWALAVMAALLRGSRRLAGDRLLACYAAAYGAGRIVTDALRAGRSDHLLGLRVTAVGAIIVLAGALAYFWLTRARRGPDYISAAPAPGLVAGAD